MIKELKDRLFFYSFMRINTLDTMAVTPPVVIPEEKIFFIVSGKWHRMSGTISTLSPKEKLSAITNVALRLIFCAAIMRIPAEATVPNISKVAPPNTGSGIKEKINPTPGNHPNRIRQPAM